MLVSVKERTSPVFSESKTPEPDFTQKPQHKRVASSLRNLSSCASCSIASTRAITGGDAVPTFSPRDRDSDSGTCNSRSRVEHHYVDRRVRVQIHKS